MLRTDKIEVNVRAGEINKRCYVRMKLIKLLRTDKIN